MCQGKEWRSPSPLQGLRGACARTQAQPASPSPRPISSHPWQAGVPQLRPSIDLAGIVEKMEVIDAASITLVRFLGSGGWVGRGGQGCFLNLGALASPCALPGVRQVGGWVGG